MIADDVMLREYNCRKGHAVNFNCFTFKLLIKLYMCIVVAQKSIYPIDGNVRNLRNK